MFPSKKINKKIEVCGPWGPDKKEGKTEIKCWVDVIQEIPHLLTYT